MPSMRLRLILPPEAPTPAARLLAARRRRSPPRWPSGLTACVGLESGIDYPNDLPSDLGPFLLTPENQPDPPISSPR